MFIGIFAFLALLCFAEGTIVTVYFWTRYNGQKPEVDPRIASSSSVVVSGILDVSAASGGATITSLAGAGTVQLGAFTPAAASQVQVVLPSTAVS